MKPLRKKIVASILIVLGLGFSSASFSYGLGYVPASASGGTSANTNNTASSATNASNNNISNQGVNSSSGSGNLNAGPINSGNSGMTYQGDINSGNTSVSNVHGSPAAAQGANVPSSPQSIFGDPGTGAVITGIPLIWYYIDSFGMRSCGDDSDPIVETTKYVSISYEADCGLKTKNSDGNIDKTKPSVKYASDLNPNAYYQPLGELMVQANWDVSDQVSLFTIIKSATNFLAKHIRGYDKVIMVGDILQRNVASQRMIEGNSQGLVISPSISSMMGRDGLAGSMFGYGKTNGESRPANRAGITLLVFAEAAGPWAGRKPNFSQFQYVSNATALPKGIQKNAEQSGVVTKQVQEETIRRATVQQNFGR